MAEKDVKERALTAMKACNISAYAIAKFCSMNERTVYEQINGNSKMGVATIEALLAYRPDLSAEWLLRGTGDMLITNKPMEINIDNSSRGHHNTNIGSIGTQTITNSDLAELKQQIAELKADKEKLYQLLLKQ